jgi:hypothetical protein
MKLDPGFASHWKTERLIARCGHGAVTGLLRLWGDCQIGRRWTGLTLNPTRLAAIMRYEGDKEELWQAMIDADAPWLDPDDGGTWAVHDFAHHQKQAIHLWEAGRRGGRPKSPPTPPSNTNNTNTHTLTPFANHMETICKPFGFSVEQVIEAGRRFSVPEDVCRAYHDDREGAGWLDGKGRRVSSMPHDLSGFWRKWQSNRSPKQFGNGTVNGHGNPKGLSVWELKQSIEQTEKEISRLVGSIANKVYNEDGTSSLRPDVAAKVKQMRAKVAEMRQAMSGMEVAA